MFNLNILSFFILILIKQIKSFLIGVDLGSEFFKVTVIKPGKPFSMMENLQSKTKTLNAIGLKDNEILYSGDARNKKPRIPKNIFNYFSEFLGKNINDESIKNYMKNFIITYDIDNNKVNDSIHFNIKFNNKDENISIEEIYAMLFNHIKFLSEKYSKIEIVDMFVTVPNFFNYHQRKAISQAAEISKLRLIGITNENTAAAVQFQFKKTFENETFYIFYDMGSSFTQVSLISFKTKYKITEHKNKNSNNTNDTTTTTKKDLGNEVKILAQAYDEELGGKYFDRNLINFMMEKFDSLPQRKNKPSVKENPKVFNKLVPDAIKYKEILSANKEALVTILGVESNIDLQFKITRDEFNEFNKDLINKVYDPIEKVLKDSNLTLENITQIELIGGGIRVPAIQDKLKEKLGKYENILGAHMNGDDSMAFGAAYMAANSTKNFRGSRKTFLQNGAFEVFRVYINNLKNESNNYNFCDENEEKIIKEDCKHLIKKNTTLFPLNYAYDSKRSVSFDLDSDIYVNITEEFPNKFGEKDLMSFEVKGVEEVLKMMKEDNITKLPRVSLIFNYGKAGEIDMNAVAKWEVPMWFSNNLTWEKNFTGKLSKDEIDEINNVLNNSKLVSEYEMKEIVKKSLNNTNNNTTNDEKDKKEEDKKKDEKDDEKKKKNKKRKLKENDKNKHKNKTKETEEKVEKNQNEKDNNEKDNNDNNNNDDDDTTEEEKDEIIIPNNFTYNNTHYITNSYSSNLKLRLKIGDQKNETVQENLSVNPIYTSIPIPFNYTQIYESKLKIRRLEEIDKNRTKLIEKRNILESLIYERKEWFEKDLNKKYGSYEELNKTLDFINNKSKWYEDEGLTSSYETLDKVINEIHKEYKKYEERMLIHYNRVVAFDKFKNDYNQTSMKVVNLLKQKNYTQDYFQKNFSKVVDEVINYLRDLEQKQNNLTLYDKPVLTGDMINKQMDKIRQSYYKMTQIKNPELNKKKEPKLEKLEDLIKNYNITDEDLKNITNSTKNNTNDTNNFSQQSEKSDL